MKKTIILFTLVLIIIGTSCRKDRGLLHNNNNVYTPEAGLGNSTAFPAGNTFTFPTGIVLTDSLLNLGGYYLCSDDTNRILGFGSYVTLLIPLRNTTADTIWLTFPGGLVCVSDVITCQNGFLLQSYTVGVPPMVNWCVTLQLSCLNLSRHIPDDRTGYTRMVVTNSAKLNELVQIMANKVPIRYTSPFVYTYSSRIQDIIWTLCDEGTFSDADKAFMNAIPNKH